MSDVIKNSPSRLVRSNLGPTPPGEPEGRLFDGTKSLDDVADCAYDSQAGVPVSLVGGTHTPNIDPHLTRQESPSAYKSGSVFKGGSK